MAWPCGGYVVLAERPWCERHTRSHRSFAFMRAAGGSNEGMIAWHVSAFFVFGTQSARTIDPADYTNEMVPSKCTINGSAGSCVSKSLRPTQMALYATYGSHKPRRMMTVSAAKLEHADSAFVGGLSRSTACCARFVHFFGPQSRFSRDMQRGMPSGVGTAGWRTVPLFALPGETASQHLEDEAVAWSRLRAVTGVRDCSSQMSLLRTFACLLQGRSSERNTIRAHTLINAWVLALPALCIRGFDEQLYSPSYFDAYREGMGWTVASAQLRYMNDQAF